MKKILLMFAVVAFLASNNFANASVASGLVMVECEKCGGKGPNCTKECKDGKKAACCKKDEAKACSHGKEGTASAEGEAPKKCGAKKGCCKSKAKAESNAAPEMKTEEAVPAEK